jgi:hypothetical protein
MLLVRQVAHVAARFWSTQRGDRPGCRRHGRKFVARIYWKGGYVHLGLFATDGEAARARKVADDLKAAGGFDRCRSRADVRRVVRQHAKGVVLVQGGP